MAPATVISQDGNEPTCQNNVQILHIPVTFLYNSRNGLQGESSNFDEVIHFSDFEGNQRELL